MKLRYYLLLLLPLSFRIWIVFLIKHGRFLRKRKSSCFSDKIQLLKSQLSSADSIYVDKLLVRDFVGERVGEQYLIPLLGVYDVASSIPQNVVEHDVVIKTNHGSGSGHIEICPSEKNYLDIISKFDKAISEKYFGIYFGECQYSFISPKILIEKKIGIGGVIPADYKFHVFGGSGRQTSFLQVDFDRFSSHKRNFYNNEFELLDLQVVYPTGDFKLPDLSYLIKMRHIALKLAQDFKYVRVDLYLVGSDIYFGELTLTPGSGFEKFQPHRYELEWGRLIEI